MKISEFIVRLEELKGVAGDVEVAIPCLLKGFPVGYELGAAEIVYVVERDGGWESLQENNTEQIVVVW